MSLPYFPVVDHTIMMNFIEIVLCRFESCFSRKAAFRWFVTITVGLMLRSDKLGLTSVIRDLALSPGSYDSMLHFFRASSWSLEDIHRRWFSAGPANRTQSIPAVQFFLQCFEASKTTKALWPLRL